MSNMHGPGSIIVEKAEKGELIKNLKTLFIYGKSYKIPIIFALLFATIGTICTLIGPNNLSKITDLIISGIGTNIDMKAVLNIVGFLVIIYSTSVILSYFQGFIMATVTQRLSKQLRTDITKKINCLPLKYFDSTTYGDVLSRVTNDVDTIGQTLNQSIGNLAAAITLLFGSIFMMYKTNWILATVAILSSFIGFSFMMVMISKSQIYFTKQQKELGLINGHIEEIYTGHHIVKIYNGQKEAKETFEKMNEKLYDCGWKSQFLSGLMMPLMGFVGNLGYVCVCVVGAALIVNGHISFGVIVAFMVYIRLFTQPLSQIAQVATSLQSTSAASKRVFEFLEETELENEEDKTVILDHVKGDVTFSHVTFGYHEDHMIIHDFSAHAHAGQKVAIVGPTGAGKTTMVNLLMRFYELNGGTIKIDGVSIDQLKRENVHQLFGMVLQDTWMFEGTIKENIVYSKQNVSQQQLEEACKAVGIHHFIKTLPKGYDTIMDDNTNLSAGQKQLITIARAMIENAPLLILDEATSSVDTRTEVLIQKAMDQLMVGRTSFVIAHRLSTIKNADLILVMKDGDILESGKHEELLEKRGFYAELYNSQFENVS